MKSQRRHDLQSNTLSRQIENLPELIRLHSSKILLVLTLLVLVVLLVRYRNDAAQRRALAAREYLGHARNDLVQLQRKVQALDESPVAISTQRNQLAAQTLNDLNEVLSNTEESDTTLRAEVYATRGDMYWTLANAPVFREAATQPSLALPEPPDALLTKAEADYAHILEKYPNEITARLTAEFGLAAIAENRGNWDQARKRYQEIENNPATPDLFKANAKSRDLLLDKIQVPVQIGPLGTEASTQPATQPAVGATTLPTTMPAGLVIPTTLPTGLIIPSPMPSFGVPSTLPSGGTTLP